MKVSRGPAGYPAITHIHRGVSAPSSRDGAIRLGTPGNAWERQTLVWHGL
jgi:hypothetical protein